MEKRVNIPVEVSQNVEELFLKYSSYISILQFFAEQGSADNPIYEKKWDETAELWIKLDKAKREVEKIYKPAGDWDRFEFDFDNHQVVFVKDG